MVRKMDINVKFILYMFKLYNKWGLLIMKIIWYVINGDQYVSYVIYFFFILIRFREQFVGIVQVSQFIRVGKDLNMRIIFY